jgi:hypothetical protein
MRAEPMKLLGLNLAIPFAVRSGFRCSGFRFTCQRRQPLGAKPLEGTLLAFKAARHHLFGPIP